MALDKLVDSAQLDSDLASVANAIRTKGGTSAQLAFPTGFVDAIDAIETGGGGWTADDVATHRFSGDVVLTATSLRAFAFADSDITSIVAPNITSYTSQPNYNGGAYSGCIFAGCSKLTHADFPIVTTTTAFMFAGCVSLVSVSIPKLKAVADYTFKGCSSLSTIVLPNLNGIIFVQAFAECSALRVADIGGPNPQMARASVFKNCSSLDTLVLRKTTVVSLSNINNFDGSPFASDGTGGTLYVPSALISSYEAATNWSTILGYANNHILPIEGSIYETQYADGTPIPTT